MQVTKRVTVDGIEFVLGMSDGRNLLKYSLPYAGNTRPMLKALTRAEADAFHKAPFTNARKILRSHGMETDSRVEIMKAETMRRMVKPAAKSKPAAITKPVTKAVPAARKPAPGKTAPAKKTAPAAKSTLKTALTKSVAKSIENQTAVAKRAAKKAGRKFAI
jgi:hypothetical protein